MLGEQRFVACFAQLQLHKRRKQTHGRTTLKALKKKSEKTQFQKHVLLTDPESITFTFSVCEQKLFFHFQSFSPSKFQS
jgi:hypothetical protein